MKRFRIIPWFIVFVYVFNFIIDWVEVIIFSQESLNSHAYFLWINILFCLFYYGLLFLWLILFLMFFLKLLRWLIRRFYLFLLFWGLFSIKFTEVVLVAKGTPYTGLGLLDGALWCWCWVWVGCMINFFNFTLELYEFLIHVNSFLSKCMNLLQQESNFFSFSIE